MDNFKKGYPPIGHKISLSKKDCTIITKERERISRILYASIVDSIMYDMICTGPDVTYSLGIVSRYQSNLGENHRKVVKTILKYLKNTKDQWLAYDETDLKIMGFTDFSF